MGRSRFFLGNFVLVHCFSRALRATSSHARHTPHACTIACTTYRLCFHVQHPLKCPESALKEPLNTASGREVAHWNEQFEWHRRVLAGRRSCS
jgi:hypothetical protein